MCLPCIRTWQEFLFLWKICSITEKCSWNLWVKLRTLVARRMPVIGNISSRLCDVNDTIFFLISELSKRAKFKKNANLFQSFETTRQRRWQSTVTLPFCYAGARLSAHRHTFVVSLEEWKHVPHYFFYLVSGDQINTLSTVFYCCVAAKLTLLSWFFSIFFFWLCSLFFIASLMLVTSFCESFIRFSPE